MTSRRFARLFSSVVRLAGVGVCRAVIADAASIPDRILARAVWRRVGSSSCRLLASAVLGATMALPASAMMGDPQPGEPAWMTQARDALQAKRFEQAALGLEAANAVDVAEWHNLLGYALRKKSPPDLVGAETHYKRALEIDPKHRHAMEYYGELFLMKGDLAGAEAMLKRLDKACFFGCEEYRDLKSAIERFKASRR